MNRKWVCVCACIDGVSSGILRCKQQILTLQELLCSENNKQFKTKKRYQFIFAEGEKPECILEGQFNMCGKDLMDLHFCVAKRV
jgi:hypothetical protein